MSSNLHHCAIAPGGRMDHVRQAGAEILAFPHISRLDAQLLETVLNNMSQGVLMFDSETRLIFCNKRYLELYGLSPEIAKPGASLRQLLDHRAERGTFTGDAEDYITRVKEGIVEGKPVSYTVTLDDGRIISIVNKPLTGGGWLATHEDVTERHRSEE